MECLVSRQIENHIYFLSRTAWLKNPVRHEEHFGNKTNSSPNEAHQGNETENETTCGGVTTV